MPNPASNPTGNHRRRQFVVQAESLQSGFALPEGPQSTSVQPLVAGAVLPRKTQSPTTANSCAAK
jgi:hypothetical protein